MRASAAVNRPLTRVAVACRVCSQAAPSVVDVSMYGMRLSSHWVLRMARSISAITREHVPGQEPCLGVSCHSNRSLEDH